MESVETKCNKQLLEVPKEKKVQRVIYFDILNILACISVVVIHMNGIVHSYSPARAWKTALIFEVICFWAVPIFIMLSGATLLTYREKYDTKTFFKKRFAKILIPWIIWSLITYIIKNKNINILTFINDFMYCKIESTYWYFPLLLFLYCIIPILAVFTENEEYKKYFKYIFGFIFIFKGIIRPLCVIIGKSVPAIFDYCLGPTGYIMYLVLGYLLANIKLSKKHRIIIYILGMMSAVIRYGYTFYFSTKVGKLNRDLFDYNSAFTVLLATAVFVFIKNINWENIINKLHINTNILQKISSCSFGIYLIHVLLKAKLTNIFDFDVNSIIYRTVGSLGLYLVCLAIVYTIKKIPILKNMVP